MRIVIGEDSALVREGIARLLVEAGHDVVAKVGDAEAVIAAAEEHRPDLLITDIRMPPGMRDDGARAARAARARRPQLPVMLLSQHLETTHSLEMVTSGAFGYLLKDRVLDLEEFLEAVCRVAAGGSVLDPEVVASLLSPPQHSTGPQQRLRSLTERELAVLGQLAEGRSNAAVARQLWMTERTVESHIRHIFTKLDLVDTHDDHRRVLAVLTYLRDRS